MDITIAGIHEGIPYKEGDVCIPEKPLLPDQKQGKPGEPMKVPNSGNKVPNPANFRDNLFNCKTKRERERLLFEWAQKTGLFCNMDREHQEYYIDLKEKYLGD